MIREGHIVTAHHAVYTPSRDWATPVRIPASTALRVVDMDIDEYGFVVFCVTVLDRPWLRTWVNERALVLVGQARPEPATIPPPSPDVA